MMLTLFQFYPMDMDKTRMSMSLAREGKGDEVLARELHGPDYCVYILQDSSVTSRKELFVLLCSYRLSLIS